MSAWNKIGRVRIGIVFVLAGATVTGLLAADKKSKRKTIQIGMVSSIFRDIPDPMVKVALRPFRVLMESQTGLRGKLVPAGDALSLGEQLSTNQLQLGVFHGFEFAWANQKYPGLRPLMIAVNRQRYLHAHFVVNQNSDIKDLAGLEGKTLAVPRCSREHCLLYLERCCLALGKEPTSFFHIDTPSGLEKALDDVAEERADAALIDGVALECYKNQRGHLYAKLKCIKKSGVFPAAVVAYHAGAVDKKTLHRFKVGMMNAKNTAHGRELLMLGSMTGFEPVPDDYQEILHQVAKTYPAPERYKVMKKQQAR
jgi:ABC-type phosphate/phosphonate transport system substrate-binding protein